jgi:hypothetical protein
VKGGTTPDEIRYNVARYATLYIGLIKKLEIDLEKEGKMI